MKSAHHFCDSPNKDIQSEINDTQTCAKPKLRDILHNNWPVIFKVLRSGKSRKD